MRRAALSGLLLALATALPPAQAAQAPPQVASTLLDRLQAGDYVAASSAFDARMHAALPAAKLQAVWASLQQRFGPLQARGTPVEQHEGATTLVAVPLHYAQQDLQARVGIDADGRIASLMIVPAPAAAAPPAAAAGEREQPTTVAGLPATLTLPLGDGRFPAVVLVHGSGAHDRDETIGPNTPFRDIADGLATRGIAVLRYDKRSYAQPESLAGSKLDLDAETTDDAVAAVALLAADPRIDARHIYVFGHSQGALLAPRIAARSGRVAGLVLLAPPARPVLDLLLEQVRARPDSGTATRRAAIAQVEDEVQRIRQPPPVGPADDAMVTLLGVAVPAGYARALDRADPIAELHALGPTPVLWLQGERDIQVTAPDWQRWQQALAHAPAATLHRYPALNHLGIAGSGPGSADDDLRPGHVDPGLIADVAAWIRAQH
jgi:uncharacterized protein